jgi:hypothetical protein
MPTMYEKMETTGRRGVIKLSCVVLILVFLKTWVIVQFVWQLK